MKKILICCLIATGFCIRLHAQDRQAILKAMETSRQAWNKGDIETFMQVYWKSDSVMFVGKKGPTFGYGNTLNNYKKNYPGKAGMGILTYQIKKVEIINKDNAFVYGGWHLQRQKDAPSGYYTLMFKKINGLWKIVVDHSS